MVAAIMIPYKALLTATRNAAQYFDAADESGLVAPGHRADLILLDANPLQDISAVQQRAGVMVRGKWFSESDIQSRLEEIRSEEHTSELQSRGQLVCRLLP